MAQDVQLFAKMTARFCDFKNDTNAVDVDRRELALPGIDSVESRLQTAQKRAPYDQYRPRWRQFITIVPKCNKILH